VHKRPQPLIKASNTQRRAWGEPPVLEEEAARAEKTKEQDSGLPHLQDPFFLPPDSFTGSCHEKAPAAAAPGLPPEAPLCPQWRRSSRPGLCSSPAVALAATGPQTRQCRSLSPETLSMPEDHSWSTAGRTVHVGSSSQWQAGGNGGVEKAESKRVQLKVLCAVRSASGSREHVCEGVSLCGASFTWGGTGPLVRAVKPRDPRAATQVAQCRESHTQYHGHRNLTLGPDNTTKSRLGALHCFPDLEPKPVNGRS